MLLESIRRFSYLNRLYNTSLIGISNEIGDLGTSLIGYTTFSTRFKPLDVINLTS